MNFRIWLIFLVFGLHAVARGQHAFDEATAEQELRHQTPEWRLLAPHLADLTTGSPQDLTLAADVLRARRMPEDALIYYRAALQRGADESSLLNRMGITLLELRQPEQARIVLKRAVLLKRKDAQSWNNLGAAEYVSGNLRGAVQAYKQALKLSKRTAVFHSNLGTAYFDLKDFESAQQQYDIAMTLDPNVFAKGGTGGLQAHMMSPTDRGRSTLKWLGFARGTTTMKGFYGGSRRQAKPVTTFTVRCRRTKALTDIEAMSAWHS